MYLTSCHISKESQDDCGLQGDYPEGMVTKGGISMYINDLGDKQMELRFKLQ